MRTATAIGLVLGLGLGVPVAGCGSSGTTPAAETGPSPTPTPPPPPPPPPPGACSDPTPTALTVKNFLSWCSVSVAGGAVSVAASQTVCVGSGVVALSATALPGFELGPTPWHDTDGDHGSGDPASATTVTVSGAAACAWVCCPFTGGTGCPTADQCP